MGGLPGCSGKAGKQDGYQVYRGCGVRRRKDQRNIIFFGIVTDVSFMVPLLVPFFSFLFFILLLLNPCVVYACAQCMLTAPLYLLLMYPPFRMPVDTLRPLLGADRRGRSHYQYVVAQCEDPQRPSSRQGLRARGLRRHRRPVLRFHATGGRVVQGRLSGLCGLRVLR